MSKRVVNINYKCDGLSFDASIDCDNALKKTLGKEYMPNEVGECRTNIELYCFDHKEWGVRFIHYEGESGIIVNDKTEDPLGILHTVCDMDQIMAATREWIKEEYEKADSCRASESWYEACCRNCKFRRFVKDGKLNLCALLHEKLATTKCCLVKTWLNTRNTEK